jgi:hypothetical protein
MIEETNTPQYPEQEAEIRLTLKIKQTATGGLSGYVYNFEVNNYEGLIPNATELAREYSFQYSSDTMIKATIDHIIENRPNKLA